MEAADALHPDAARHRPGRRVDPRHHARAAGTPAWADNDDIEIKDVGKVKRGDKEVKLRAEVGKANLKCTWRVKYADGDTDTVGEDESDDDGICEVKIDLPERTSVVGWATAKVKVETKKGSDRGSESRNFFVRPRRGG